MLYCSIIYVFIFKLKIIVYINSHMSLENIIHSEFLIDPDILYLNHAAVSPWPVRTANAVKQFADENVHLGASRYLDWLKIEADLRKKIKVMLNAPSADDIALLKNTSEALSVVAFGIDWRDGDNIVSTDQEFPSNRIVWEAQARHGVEFRQVDVMPPAGTNDEPNDLDDPESALISACNERTRVMSDQFCAIWQWIKAGFGQTWTVLSRQYYLFLCRCYSEYWCTSVRYSGDKGRFCHG